MREIQIHESPKEVDTNTTPRPENTTHPNPKVGNMGAYKNHLHPQTLHFSTPKKAQKIINSNIQTMETLHIATIRSTKPPRIKNFLRAKNYPRKI